jgi:hypothetical protein
MDKVRSYLRLILGISAEVLGYAVLVYLMALGAVYSWNNLDFGNEFRLALDTSAHGVDVSWSKPKKK